MGRPRARASARVFATHSRALHSTRAFASPETRYRWCFWTRFLSPASTPRPAASVAVSRVTMRFVAAITRSRRICTQLPSMRRPRPRRWPPPSSETVRRRTSRWTAPLTRSRTPSVPSRSAPPSRPTRPSPDSDSATPSSPSVAPRTRARRIATPSSTPPATPPSSTDSGRRARRCARPPARRPPQPPRPRPRPGRLAPPPSPTSRTPTARFARGATPTPSACTTPPAPPRTANTPSSETDPPPSSPSVASTTRSRTRVGASVSSPRTSRVDTDWARRSTPPSAAPNPTRRPSPGGKNASGLGASSRWRGRRGTTRSAPARVWTRTARRCDEDSPKPSSSSRISRLNERERTPHKREPSPSPSEIPMFHLAAIRREPHDSERATAFRDAVRTHGCVRVRLPSPRDVSRAPLARFRRRGGRRRRVFQPPRAI